MRDRCKCGHGRPLHLGGFKACTLCVQKHAGFKSEPGACDRFTCPKGEDDASETGGER